MSGKRLYRSRDDRMIAGVCGGLGEYFSIDPTIVRLILLFLMLWGGGGILVYILAWIVIPEQPVSAKAPTSASKELKRSLPHSLKRRNLPKLWLPLHRHQKRLPYRKLILLLKQWKNPKRLHPMLNN